MKRDMDLVRAILLAVEAKPNPKAVSMAELEVDGYPDSSERRKHIVMMAREGFFDCEKQYSSTTPDRIFRATIFDLTWKGHDYLDSIRDPKIWNATKKKVSQIGGASFDLVLEIAKAIAKQQLVKIGISA